MMDIIKSNMSKKIFIFMITILFIGAVWAQNDSNITLNNVNFEIPSKYKGGEIDNNRYELNNEFSIECVDDNLEKHIGLWACEKEYEKNLTIGKHPVRYYCQYNQYVHDNQSHAYFASGDSIYEIGWTGNEITKEIEDMIRNTPPAQIDYDEFYYELDKSIDLYKKERTGKLNQEGEYNYLEAKYKSSPHTNEKKDDTHFKEILLTHYRK